jgi:hypothetical protein
MKPLLAALICLFVNTTAIAFDPLETEQKIQHQDTETDWKEAAPKVPEHVDTDDLQAFTVPSADNRFRYFIERSSLETGDDWITRFVLVIRSREGAVNSSYEGLRCGYRMYKVYAYGDSKRLTPISGAKWQPISRRDSDYRATLYNDLVCNSLTGRPNPPTEVFNAMRSGRQVDTPFVDQGN